MMKKVPENDDTTRNARAAARIIAICRLYGNLFREKTRVFCAPLRDFALSIRARLC